MTTSLWIVPPYNNVGWPEVQIFEDLCISALNYPGDVHWFSLPPPRSGPGLIGDGFTAEAQVDAIKAFADQLYECAMSGHFPDAMLLCEAWSPLPQMARILSRQMGYSEMHMRLTGLLHGGYHVPHDKLALIPAVEKSIHHMYDALISPTTYHAAMYDPDERVTVERWPLSHQLWKMRHAFADIQKEPTVIFPHRQVEEKGWPLWQAARADAEMQQDWRFVETARATKQDLYFLMISARAVFASVSLETYGIAVEEAISLGCCPVLNRHDVYVELYGERGQVHWHDGTVEGVRRALGEVELCRVDHAALLGLSADESERRATHILDISFGHVVY